MNSIQPEDIASLKVSSLPSRPTAPASFGGLGYTATDLKAAFDRLPLFLVGKLNTLISEVTSLSASLSALTTRVGTVEATDTAQNGRLTAAESDVDSLTTDLATASSALSAQGARLSVAESAVGTLSAQLSTLLSSVSALTQRVTTAEGTIVSHTGTLSTLGSDVDTAESTLLSHTGSLATLDSALSALSSAVSSTSDTVSALSSTQSVFAASLSLLDTRLSALESGGASGGLQGFDCQTPADRHGACPSVLECGFVTEKELHDSLIFDAGNAASRISD